MSRSRRAAAQPVPSTTSRCLPVSSGRLSGVYTVLSACTRRERHKLLRHVSAPAAAVQLLQLLLHSALDSRHPCCLLMTPRAIFISEEPRCKRDMLVVQITKARKQQQRHLTTG
jgi:hypothetical protein